MTPRSLIITLGVTATTAVFLAGCGQEAKAPKTMSEKAAEYGMTKEQYKEAQQKAAQMNMNMGEHMTMDKDKKKK